MATVDYLDKRVPVPLTMSSLFFERTITGWRDSKTVAQQVHRAAVNDIKAILATQQPMWKPQRQTTIWRFLPSPPESKLDDTLTDMAPVALIEDKPLDWIAPTEDDLTEFQKIWNKEDKSRLTLAVKRTANLAMQGIHRLFGRRPQP